jgi:dissimilatory sulfite reductase (desulfoviridin) alpha/beta subunit
MKKEHQHILDLLAVYLEKYPDQRFGQVLFNLGINEFKEPVGELYQLRDNYNDSDQEIIRRMEKQFNSHNELLKET